MNSGVTAERVYDALKRRILEREFRPGARLDPALLSDSLHSSVTPIRDCLNTLTGEGLVETRTGDGFHLPHVDAPGLQDLYEWNADVLLLALRRRRANDTQSVPDRPIGPGPRSITDATATLFAAIARRSSNAEHGGAIASANDRLHAARIVEARMFADDGDEIAALRRAVASGAADDARRIIVAYHRRRGRRAAETVRLLYRDDDRDR